MTASRPCGLSTFHRKVVVKLRKVQLRVEARVPVVDKTLTRQILIAVYEN